jgi:hypothetical protein
MQTIIAGAGAQSVEVYAFDALGRVVKPTSATARIVDLDFSEDAADADRIIATTIQAAAVVDTLSTTTTVAAGPLTGDPRKIVITAGVPVVGVRYVITSAGHTESFIVERVDSLNIYARDELRGTFAVGATVTGCRVTASFPSARANLATELDRRTIYGVDWVFVGSGVTPLYRRTLCRIERRARAPRATVADVVQIDPRFAAGAHESTRLESHVLQADAEVSARLMHRGTQLANTDDGEVGRMAVAFRAAELAYRTLGDTYDGRAEWAMGEARSWLKLLLSGHKPDDVIDVRRDLDVRRGTRSAASWGLVTE